jgi:hypothetical protein
MYPAGGNWEDVAAQLKSLNDLSSLLSQLFNCHAPLARNANVTMKPVPNVLLGQLSTRVLTQRTGELRLPSKLLNRATERALRIVFWRPHVVNDNNCCLTSTTMFVSAKNNKRCTP